MCSLYLARVCKFVARLDVQRRVRELGKKKAKHSPKSEPWCICWMKPSCRALFRKCRNPQPPPSTRAVRARGLPLAEIEKK